MCSSERRQPALLEARMLEANRARHERPMSVTSQQTKGDVRYVQFGCTAHSSRGGAICTNAATVSERKINEALLETLANETLSIPNVMKEFAEQFENRASEKIEKGPGDLERELRAAENRVTSATRLMVEMPDDLDLRRQRESDQNEVRRLKDAIAAQTGAAASCRTSA